MGKPEMRWRLFHVLARVSQLEASSGGASVAESVSGLLASLTHLGECTRSDDPPFNGCFEDACRQRSPTMVEREWTVENLVLCGRSYELLSDACLRGDFSSEALSGETKRRFEQMFAEKTDLSPQVPSSASML